MDVKNGKLLYHLTHIDNLDSIIENGLLSRNDVLKRGLLKEDVANPEILSKRQINGLDEYIPFHFHPYTAFDVAVKGQEASKFVYITYFRDKAECNNFQIVPRHPLNGRFEIYSYKEGFNQIEWDLMEKNQSEVLSSELEHHKEVRMAECLSEEFIPSNDFAYIYCNEQLVEELKARYPLVAHKIRGQVWLNDN